MRKNIYSLVATALCALFLSSCFDESGLEKVFDGPSQVEFDWADQPEVVGHIYNPPGVTEAQDNIRINLIGPHQSQPINVQWEFLAGESTAIEGVHFRFATTSRTVTIPANSSSADIPIEILMDNFEVGERLNIVARITGADVMVAPNLSKTTYTFYKLCPSDIAGRYSTLMSGRYGSGGSASYSNFASEVTLAVRAAGGYTISDMSFGIYSAVYGDPAQPGVIMDICNSVTMSGTDQYGDPFTGTGTVNADGTINLTWSNTYGESGTGVLTPIE